MHSKIFLYLAIAGLFLACQSKGQEALSYSDVEYGKLSVPENRKDPESRQIEITYAVLKAVNRDSSRLPIIFLQGGPGGSSLPMIPFWEQSPLLQDRDIILFDQRGTGQSEAYCPTVGAQFMEVMAKDLTTDEEYQAILKISNDCRAQLKHYQVDRSGYHTGENAADVEALRQQLGIDKWILLGGSYGTRLALKYLSNFDGAAAAILMGVFPPEANLYADLISNLHGSLRHLFATCAGDPACRQQYPDLQTDFYELIDELRTQPLQIDFRRKAFVINAQDALLLVHQMLYNRQTIARIPALIQALRQVQREPIQQAIATTRRTFDFVNAAMYWSVNAYEEVAFNSETAILEDLERNAELIPGPAFFASDPAVLQHWHEYRADPSENLSVEVRTPLLIFNGAFDPITPTSNARKAMVNWPNAHLIEFPYEGHTTFNPCFYQSIQEFLNSGYQPPRGDCRGELKPIVFVEYGK